jgi:hypothetical protein
MGMMARERACNYRRIAVLGLGEIDAARRHSSYVVPVAAAAVGFASEPK